MLGRDQGALVYKFSKEQAALQEHLKDLGKKPMLRRLDVPVKSQAELKMLSWLKRRRVHERPPPVDNQMEWAPVEDYPQDANPSEMTGPARAPDPDNLRTEQPPSDNMSTASVGDAISVEDVCQIFVHVSCRTIEEVVVEPLN